MITHELSIPRAIWWGNRYLGTLVPSSTDITIMKHNMDVDYFLSKEAGWLITKPAQEMTREEVDAWYLALLDRGFRETESLEHSRDLRDAWFFGNTVPSWVPKNWKDELVIGAGG